MSWFITADYDCGGSDMKRAELNIRSIMSGEILSVFSVTFVPGKPVLPILSPAPPIPPPIALAPPIEPVLGDQLNNQPYSFHAEEELMPQMPINVPPPLPSLPPMHQPTTIGHQTEWWEDPKACQMLIGGSVLYREWSMHTD
jgi:hypothetical protein